MGMFKAMPAVRHTHAGDTIMELPSMHSLRQRELELTNSRVDSPSANESTFKIRVANDNRRRKDASALIHERYGWRGYKTEELREDAHRMTIIAYEGDSKVGTLSIGMDGPDGLLSDALYKSEIDDIRATGRKVCEVIKFAVDTEAYSVNTLAALFHTVFIFAYRIRGFDDVVVEVNPRHARFYQRGLGFRQIGEQRMNQRVMAPAVLLHCEFAHVAAKLEAVSAMPMPRQNDKTLYPYCLTPQEEEYIRNRLMRLHP